MEKDSEGDRVLITKAMEESTQSKDASVPLLHHDLNDLRLIY